MELSSIKRIIRNFLPIILAFQLLALSVLAQDRFSWGDEAVVFYLKKYNNTATLNISNENGSHEIASGELWYSSKPLKDIIPSLGFGHVSETSDSHILGVGNALYIMQSSGYVIKLPFSQRPLEVIVKQVRNVSVMPFPALLIEIVDAKNKLTKWAYTESALIRLSDKTNMSANTLNIDYFKSIEVEDTITKIDSYLNLFKNRISEPFGTVTGFAIENHGDLVKLKRSDIWTKHNFSTGYNGMSENITKNSMPSLFDTSTDFAISAADGFEIKRTKTSFANEDTYSTNNDAGSLQQLRDELGDLKNIKEHMSKSVFGQEPAINAIVGAIKEARINDIKTPTVVMAMGPSGAGKSFSAEILSEVVNKGAFLQINGNEYSAHAGALDYLKLLSSQGGSSSKDGVLVQMIKDNPTGFTVVIDEAEKMHPDIWKMLMEFLDKGRLTDKDGRVVSAENVTVVMTSNRGVKRMFPKRNSNWTEADVSERLRSLSKDDLASMFTTKDGVSDNFQLPEEIVKRIKYYVPFGPTTKAGALGIAKKIVSKLTKHYLKKYGLKVEASLELVEHMAVSSWVNSQDARSVGNETSKYISQMFEKVADIPEAIDGDTVKLDIKIDLNSGELLYETNVRRAVRTTPSIKTESNHPFRDDVSFRHKIMNFSDLMKKTVTGQDEVLSEMEKSLLNHFALQVKRPFSALLVGPSGNGKTEIGRAMAKTLYNDSERIAVLSMGDVKDSEGYGKMFGISAQYRGGENESPFEEVLRKYPQGAVIVLDEISNMGKSRAEKQDLLTRFYQLLEEGEYRSPSDGRLYDLSKFQFIMTGNDMEGLFANLTDDHLIIEQWKENKSQSKLRDHLRKTGWPNALLNRLKVLALTKPLLSKDSEFVARKLWADVVKQYETQYKGLKIEASPELIKQIKDKFYSADQGGRASRKALEEHISPVVAKALGSAKYNLQKMDGIVFKISLSDDGSTKAYRAFKNSKPRSVIASLDILQNGRRIGGETVDISLAVNQQILLSSGEARRVAIHEAGHAVANIPELTAQKTSFISIRGGKMGEIEYLGFASTKPIDSAANASIERKHVIGRIANLYGGRLAEEMAGYKENAGWSDDYKKIVEISTKYLVDWGLEKSLQGIRVDKDGNYQPTEAQQLLIQKHIQKLIAEGRSVAEARLKQRWPLVRQVVAEILRAGEITGARFDELDKQFEASERSKKSPPENFLNERVRTFIEIKRGKLSATSSGFSCKALFGY